MDEGDKSAMESLPDSVKRTLYTDVAVHGTTLSVSDQITMLETLGSVDLENTDGALDAIENLPDTVYGLIKPSIDMDKVFTVAVTLVVMYVMSYIFSAVQSFGMATVTQRVSQKMRSDISGKINRLPMWYYNKTSTGDVLSRVTNDVDTIGQSLNQSISGLVSAIVLFLGSLVMMLKTNLIMTVTAMLASLLGVVFMFLIMAEAKSILPVSKSIWEGSTDTSRKSMPDIRSLKHTTEKKKLKRPSMK